MPARYEELTLHIQALGGDHEIQARVRLGRTGLQDLLPLAREISGGMTKVAIRSVVGKGLTVPCRAGCDACCWQVVPVAPVEALRFFELVEALPPPRRRVVKARFEGAIRRLQEAGLITRHPSPGDAALLSDARTDTSPWEDASRRYFDARIPCPFLEESTCSIYNDRPLSCREFHVTTDAHLCATLSPLVRGIPRLVRMSEVLTVVTNRLLRRRDNNILLPLSPDWARANRKAFRLEGDGRELAMQLIQCIQAADEAEIG